LSASAYSCFLGKSFADPEKATVLIDNRTNARIPYQFKWGADGQWKDYILEGGYYRTHRKKYISTGVPPPYIKFRRSPFFAFPGLFGIRVEGLIDVSKGENKIYKLGIGWDNDPKRYYFEAENNILDLFED
jgi:hypothetical protein